MVEVRFANFEELSPRSHTPDLMQETPRRLDTQAKEVQILLHFLHLGALGNLRRTNCVIKRPDILHHINASRTEESFPASMLTNLVEDPRIANRSASNH